MIASSVAKSIARSVAQAVSSVGGGGVATPFVATPSTATPVAGVDVTWSTNAGDLGTPVSYYWDFGDGTIPGSGATPEHFYTRPGPFTVTSIVTYADDSTDTDTQVITPLQSYAKTLVNKPYQDGTALPDADDASWTKSNITVTPAAAVAPDGTTTACELDVGSATAARYMQATIAVSNGTYALVCYAKYVDLRYLAFNVYTNDAASVIFDIQNGLVVTAAAVTPILGVAIDSVGSGWYRCSVTVKSGATTMYPTIYPTTSSALTSGGDLNPGTYTGTDQTMLIWGLQLISGGDDYSPTVHYLGGVQTPVPTLTVDLPEADPYAELIHAIVFDEEYNSGSFGDFAGWLGNQALSVPVGAKLLAPVNVGWSGINKGSNWAGTWNIGTPKTSGLGFRAAGWVYFDALPAGEINVAGLMIGNGNHQSIGVDASGNIRKQDYSTNSTISATRITAKNWYWFGYATIGTSVKLLFKTASGDVETLYDGSAGAQLIDPNNANRAFVGAYNSAGNVVNNMRISLPTLHYIRSLDDVGYAGEVIRPQDENHIYRIDPVSGDDTADGVTTAWETVTRANSLMSTDVRGIISNAAAATTIDETGLGSWLEIDTSAQRFDVGVVGLVLNTEAMWLKPISGQTYIDFQAEVLPAPGDWTVTGGYTGIYQTAIDDDDTRVFQDNIYHAPVADLTALDAAAAGASCVVANVLYIKPYGGTDPRSDGKTYAYGRIRPDYVGDPVGLPVVNFKARDLRVTGVKTNITAVNGGGSYAVGDTSGISGKALLETIDCRRGDKHVICWTINATDSEIVCRNGIVDQSLDQALTDYMGGGASFDGNVHRWQNVQVINGGLLARSSVGVPYFCYYSHGGGSGNYDLIEIENCDWGDNDVAWQYVALARTMDGCTFGALQPVGGTVAATNNTASHIPTLFGGSFTDNVVTPVDVQLNTPRTISGAVTIADNDFDLRDFLGGFSAGLWLSDGTADLTFTGNTVRFGSTGDKISCPIFKDMASANIVECNNNTYYIGASDIFAKAFDSGSGPEDLTWAQWQALGYDAASTRLDP